MERANVIHIAVTPFDQAGGAEPAAQALGMMSGITDNMEFTTCDADGLHLRSEQHPPKSPAGAARRPAQAVAPLPPGTGNLF
jgi:hypothetical protein